MVARRSPARSAAGVLAGAVVAAAACSGGAGLGERCGEWGHGTIACADDFYCSLAAGESSGTCKRAGRENEACPDVILPSCAGDLTCNRAFSPPLCTPPIAQGMDCTNAACVAGLICLVKPAGPPTCEPPRLEGEGCLNAYGQCAGDLVCLPYAGVAEGGVCGARVAAGNVCDDAQDCQAGLTCNAGFPPSRCEPLSEIGQPCGSVQDCKSLNCDLATAACAPSAAATTGW